MSTLTKNIPHANINEEILRSNDIKIEFGTLEILISSNFYYYFNVNFIKKLANEFMLIGFTLVQLLGGKGNTSSNNFFNVKTLDKPVNNRNYNYESVS